MLLAVDIGNSNISFGVFDIDSRAISAQSLICHFKISTRNLSADEYALLIHNFLKINNIGISEHSGYFSESDNNAVRRTVSQGVISSVVPSLTGVLADAVELLCGASPLIIGAGVHTGLGIRIKNPEQLGSDIVSNSAFAVDVAEPPIAVLDVGTATTLTIIDKNRNILGTVIMPGMNISMSALSGSAAQLNDISLFGADTSPIPLIGRDSAESIRSGVVNGQAIMVDGFLRSIREQMAHSGDTEKLSLISTGGLAHLVLPLMRNKFTDYPALTLFGAAKIFLLNNK